MNLHVRRIKNRSGNIGVQVVSQPNRKIRIEKHFGTARKQEELEILLKEAQEYIKSRTMQQALPFNAVNEDFFNQISLKKVSHKYAYEFLSQCYQKLGFDVTNSRPLKDLSIIRIIEPTSKIKAIELLNNYYLLPAKF